MPEKDVVAIAWGILTGALNNPEIGTSVPVYGKGMNKKLKKSIDSYEIELTETDTGFEYYVKFYTHRRMH